MRRKILLFHRTLKQSGAARQLVNLYRGLDRERFDPFFVLEHDHKIFYGQEIADARILTLGARSRHSRPVRMQNLHRIIEDERPDLIQSFNHRSNRYFYEAGWNRSLPPVFASIRNTEQPWKHLVREAFYQFRRRFLVVNSQAIRTHLVHAGVWPGRIRAIPNGVDVDVFRPADGRRRLELRHRLGLADDDFVVLAVGRVAPQKSLETTVRAVAKLAHEGASVRFVNVGLNHKPDHRRALQQIAATAGITSRCLFVDPVKQIADYYHLADAMVLSSAHEGLPNVLLENMACGGVSIVSSSADNDSVVQHEDTGFRFRVGHVEGLTRDLRRVIGLDRGDRRLMGERARKDVCERFSIPRMVRSFESLYEQGASGA